MSGPCVFDGCTATVKHWHGPFWGGYENPEDPSGPPIPFPDPLERLREAADRLVSDIEGPEPRHGLWSAIKRDAALLRAALEEIPR